jgi:anaerobic selenocysteine-containing dehydrogenase
MTEERETKAAKRRDFLKLAGGSAAGGVAAVAAAGVAPAEAASAEAERSCYRETDHIRKVYELARF